MLSPVIKNKIQARYKHEIKYAKQCEALAAHISLICKCKISASTIKRLWGFIKGPETTPRLWTLDIIAEYIGGYKCWEELQNDLAGNKSVKNERVEYVDCSLLKPGNKLSVLFGKTIFLKIECIGKNWFLLQEENKTSLKLNDEIELEKIQIELPVTIKRIKRNGTMSKGFILGAVTGVTEITDASHATSKQTNGLLTSK